MVDNLVETSSSVLVDETGTVVSLLSAKSVLVELDDFPETLMGIEIAESKIDHRCKIISLKIKRIEIAGKLKQ